MKANTLKSYDYMDIKKEVNTRLGYDMRSAGKHFYPESMTFEEWSKSTGIDNYGEYQKSGKEIPYMDFWHFQADYCFMNGVSNDSYLKLYVGSPDDSEEFKDAEEWQKEIQRVWCDVCKDFKQKYGYITVWMCW